MIAVIVALDSKNGFSKNGEIPWYYSEDFKHFRALTTNQICVMGRNTYTDINNRLNNPVPNVLPNRLNVVLSNTIKRLDNALVFNSIDDFVDVLFQESRTTFFIGGAQIFNIGLKLADILYITRINHDYDCDQQIDMKYINDNFHIVHEKEGETSGLLFIEYHRNK